jgi:hypothetical protein
MTTNVPASEMSSSSGAGHRQGPTIARVCRDIDLYAKYTVEKHNECVSLTQKLAQVEADRDTFRAQANRGGA